ncbi:hypothetical protein PMIN04_012014 [Paraphaeosphaeria minitans]|uniref:Uncharacterized protein n=1 Tax=Paraphaeosphaeria minitans TaxID=565426 RepID=A0A9P6G9M2_9PLEO|nr:hypothetical protein PMIN01_12152 [Paraphaeosphaeria minitans]
MPSQCTKKRSVTTRPTYLCSNAGAFPSTKTENSNISGEDNSGYDYFPAAVMLLDLSPELEGQVVEDIVPLFDTETCPLPQDVSEHQRNSPVDSEEDGGVVEEAFTQPDNQEETMLVFPIAVHSRPGNGHGALLAEDMDYQVLEFECSFLLYLTSMLRIVTLNAPSQSYHGPSASCGASKVEEELWIELVEDNEDYFVHNQDSLNNRYAERCVS